MGYEVEIIAYNVKLDDDLGTVKDVTIVCNSDDFEDINDKDEVENLLEDRISDVTGYCHFGWDSWEMR